MHPLSDTIVFSCFLNLTACRSGGITNVGTDTDIDTNTKLDTYTEAGSALPDFPGFMPLNCGARPGGTTTDGHPNKWKVHDCCAQAMSGPKSLKFIAPSDNYEVDARLTILSRLRPQPM